MQPGKEQETLRRKIASLPTATGVYLFKDSFGNILYIGKAKNLRGRVRSYFLDRKPVDAKTKALRKKIAEIDFIVTNSEMEALILEDSLIKQYQPRYNVQLRDDKSYPYIRVTNEPFPRVLITRTVVRDGSKYFGPYTDAKQLRAFLKTLRSIFPFRSCTLPLTEERIQAGKFSLCIDYQIQKCDGPCEGKVSQQEYQGMIQQVLRVLKGKVDEVLREIRQLIERLAAEKRFEEAARWRDRYHVLQKYAERQTVLSTEPIDRDVWGIAVGSDRCSLAVLRIRGGRLLSKNQFVLQNIQGYTSAELLQAGIEKYYLHSEDIPNEIFLPEELPEQATLQQYLEHTISHAVRFFVPKKGEKAALIQMAQANAAYVLHQIELQKMRQTERVPEALIALRKDLQLEKVPFRIECFDNSHIQGSDFVAAVVVFVGGKPKKSEYRRYYIKTAENADDYQAMREVVYRRYRRLLEENLPLPDLIVIDGGKGQLSAALESLAALNIAVPIIGLAKRLEEIFLPGQSESLLLPKSSQSLRLLQRIRNEAHRFAITFHRKVRENRVFASELLDIPGVGEKTAKKLLLHFGSLHHVQGATLEQLATVVGKRQAERIYRYFHPQTDNA